MKPIRIGRWQAELHQRAIHITREPDPNCATCAGHGGIEVYTLNLDSPETELCDCWDPAPIIRVPLWIRHTERAPF